MFQNGQHRTWTAFAIASLVVMVSVSAAWWRHLVTQSNVIDANPSWTVLKREVLYHPSAFEDFANTPIDDAGINLWRGQGFQGLRWNGAQRMAAGHDDSIDRVEIRATLDHPGAYLYLLFGIDAQGSRALLLSSDSERPSGFYRFDASWRALEYEALTTAVEPPIGEALAVQLEFERPLPFGRDAVVTASLDGRVIGSLEVSAAEPLADPLTGTFGIKGGFLPVRVQRVEVRGIDEAGTSYIWVDDFRHGSADGLSWTLLILSLAMVSLVSISIAASSPGGRSLREKASHLWLEDIAPRIAAPWTAALAFSWLAIAFRSSIALAAATAGLIGGLAFVIARRIADPELREQAVAVTKPAATPLRIAAGTAGLLGLLALFGLSGSLYPVISADSVSDRGADRIGSQHATESAASATLAATDRAFFDDGEEPSRSARRLGAVGLNLGQSLPLASSGVGDQSARFTVTMEPDSLLEVRFWEPDPPSGTEFQCAETWYGFLLSTVPQIESGFYRYRRGPEPLALFPGAGNHSLQSRLLSGAEITLQMASSRLTASVDGRIVASASLNNPFQRTALGDRDRDRDRDPIRTGDRALSAGPTGGTGLYVFAGRAHLRDLDWRAENATALSSGAEHQAAKIQPVGTSEFRSAISHQPLSTFATFALALALIPWAAKLRRISAVAVLSLFPTAAFGALGSVLENRTAWTTIDSRWWLWTGVALALLVASGSLAAQRGPGVRRLIATVTAITVLGGFGWAFLGSWSNSFQVVQIEMNDPIPPTSYDWLWYRHPSFRACNPFVLDQTFAGRRVNASSAAGDNATDSNSTRRVITLGASQTFGFGASSREQTYPSHLEENLRRIDDRYEVLNAGVPGSFTFTARSYFEGVLRHYQPEIVVLNFCAADYVYLSLLSLEGIDPQERLEEIALSGWTPSVIDRLLANARSWQGYRRFRSGVSADFDWVRASYLQSLGRLTEVARETGAEVFIVLEPRATEVEHPMIDYGRLYETARRVAALHDARVIDPGPALQRAERAGVLWWDYAHLTDFGYQVLAYEVAREISDAELSERGS